MYIYIYIYQCAPVISNGHHMPKCTNYHDDIDQLIITGRALCLPF